MLTKKYALVRSNDRMETLNGQFVKEFAPNQAHWLEAYSSLRLSDEEVSRRFIIVLRTLLALRNLRGYLSEEPLHGDSSQQLLRLATKVIHSLELELLSPNTGSDPQDLVNLEAQFSWLPPATVNSSFTTITHYLPEGLSFLFQSYFDFFICYFLSLNRPDLNPELKPSLFFEKLETIRDKKILVIAPLSAGAVVAPFFVNALQKLGFNAFLEVCAPLLDSQQSKSHQNLTDEVIMLQEKTTQPDLIVLLDDRVGQGDTMHRVHAATEKKYGNAIEILGGKSYVATPML